MGDIVFRLHVLQLELPSFVPFVIPVPAVLRARCTHFPSSDGNSDIHAGLDSFTASVSCGHVTVNGLGLRCSFNDQSSSISAAESGGCCPRNERHGTCPRRFEPLHWARAVCLGQQEATHKQHGVPDGKGGTQCRPPNIQPAASSCASCFHQDSRKGIQCRGKICASKSIDEQGIWTPKGGRNLFRREQRAVRCNGSFAKHHHGAVWFGLGVQRDWIAHLQHDRACQDPQQTRPHCTTSTRDMCCPLADMA